jgi:hypothetical protein
MSSQAAAFSDDLQDAPAPDRDDWARPLIERQLAVLSDLTEAALAVSLSLQRKITSSPHPERVEGRGGEVESLTLAFTRAARAVRLTIALQSRLIELRQQWAKDEAADGRSRAADRHDAAKARVESAVRRVAAAADNDDETLERLSAEARERLDDDEDVFGEILARPVSEILALIRHDLGLAPDWPKLAEEPPSSFASLRMRATEAQSGSPPFASSA